MFILKLKIEKRVVTVADQREGGEYNNRGNGRYLRISDNFIPREIPDLFVRCYFTKVFNQRRCGYNRDNQEKDLVLPHGFCLEV